MTNGGTPEPNLPFNLLREAWLPVRRRSGARALIRPAELADAADPPIALDWPRADFGIASLEFLIGLLATAWPPASSHAWLDAWHAPPDTATLDAAFAPIAHAFDLDGDGPRFLQDLEDLVSDEEPVERLLIEAPGASTTRQNTDLLVRRDRFPTLGRAAAAMALFTFQSWAPAGGAGNRTGLRGGGPMTTLVVPSARPTLWQQVWANVPIGEAAAPTGLPRIFPWLAPTVTSEGTRTVTPESAHPLQAFWGMPRRIRLDFVRLDRPEPCSLTGTPDSVHVRSWRQRPRGANYALWGGQHPLTPHYRAKEGGEWLPLHPQPGGVGYRHWLGLVMASPDGLRLPARTVATWRDSRAVDARAGDMRLLAAGYDMDNMKARGFVESEMPLPAAASAQDREAAAQLVEAADQVARLLRSAVRGALFGPGATVKLDAEVFAALRDRFWEETERDFFALIAARPPDASDRWLARLRAVALALFDEAAPIAPETGANAPRIGRARRQLLFALTGFGKDGEALFERLGLAKAQPRARKGRGKAA